MRDEMEAKTKLAKARIALKIIGTKIDAIDKNITSLTGIKGLTTVQKDITEYLDEINLMRLKIESEIKKLEQKAGYVIDAPPN